VLHGAGTSLTLNGIAQGYAADRAMAALAAHGIEHALIDTGELAGLGRRQGSPWRIGIQHPRAADAFIALARLDHRCLATSGDYATAFSPDHRYNHIFDPRSGDSPQELASVSIAAPTAMEADALSTAAFVLGAQGALDLLATMPGVDALLVLKTGGVIKSNGFPLEQTT
jgi:FAD:protein FMN transferase